MQRFFFGSAARDSQDALTANPAPKKKKGNHRVVVLRSKTKEPFLSYAYLSSAYKGALALNRI